MREQLISFDTAKLAKEKGFDMFDGAFYDEIWGESKLPGIHCEKFYQQHKGRKGVIAAPTQALLQKWLRETHNISVLVEHGRMEDDSFGYFTRVYTDTSNSSMQFKVFDYCKSYEDALEFGLIEALKWIK